MELIILILVALVIGIALGAFEAWLALLIWNAVFVPVFGLPALGFMQMWGIFIFINLITSGFKITRSN